MNIKDNKNIQIRRIAVLGAGVMGAQIAAHAVNAGFEVLLMDLPVDGKDRNSGIRQSFQKAMKLSPAPLASQRFAGLVTFGNFETDLHLLSNADWILEAVVERLDIKQALWAKVLDVAKPDAVLSTNTSGLPLHQIAQHFPAERRQRFMGTHFFNPPRYLHLFEMIALPDTDLGVFNAIAELARVRLGKGVVFAKDTPNFIANRIGTYAMLGVVAFLERGYSVEELDFLSGPLSGRPNSATFRTADVVGLDTLGHVCRNLFAAIPHDDARARFEVPAVLQRLIEGGKLGSKTKAGFYFKKGQEILSLDPVALEYVPAKAVDFPELGGIKKSAPITQRIKALFTLEGRAGTFFKETLADTVWYAAHRLPEISDVPADVDNALKWGFGWEIGPFEMADAIGISHIEQQLNQHGRSLPLWCHDMLKTGSATFYNASKTTVYGPAGLHKMNHFDDEWSVSGLRTAAAAIWSNEEAGLLHAGDDVLLLEFRSKANTLGNNVVKAVIHAVNELESGHWKALVIGNDGANFSVGANLAEMAAQAAAGNLEGISTAIQQFQEMVQRVRYASKPVVAAVRGKTLGGGCELAMACAGVAASLETYAGLVELGVGLMPAGTGSMHFAWRAQEQAASDFPSHIQPFLVKAFETVATARVSGSAVEAIDLGYLPANTRVVLHNGRVLHAAKQWALGLAHAGYAAPARRTGIRVLGKNGRATLESAAWMMQQSGLATEYDRFLAGRFAYILTGGELTGPAEVSEDYLLKLEREVFVALLREPKTQERIKGVLTDNKPVRN
jgi:3-hydroxyacyl-CoA dehydrogenase